MYKIIINKTYFLSKKILDEQNLLKILVILFQDNWNFIFDNQIFRFFIKILLLIFLGKNLWYKLFLNLFFRCLSIVNKSTMKNQFKYKIVSINYNKQD